MKKVSLIQMEAAQGGGGACEFVSFSFLGIGGALTGAIVTAPLGAAFLLAGSLYFVGGCGK